MDAEAPRRTCLAKAGMWMVPAALSTQNISSSGTAGCQAGGGMGAAAPPPEALTPFFSLPLQARSAACMACGNRRSSEAAALPP